MIKSIRQSKNFLKNIQSKAQVSEALSTSFQSCSSPSESHWKDYLFAPIYSPSSPAQSESHWKNYLFAPVSSSSKNTSSASIQNSSAQSKSHWKDYLFPPVYSPPTPVSIKDTSRVKPEYTPKVTEKECVCIIQSPSQDDLKNLPHRSSTSGGPLVILFGWAGSTHKNLDKYSSLYRRAGCTTIQYILPTRHIFRDTSQIPEIMEQIYSQMKSPFLSLSKRPIFLHCMSDTGVMCYQGLDHTLQKHGEQLDIKGVVWDSCPGPRPEMTLPRVAALIAVNMFCCIRDGLTYAGSILNTYKLLMDRAVPGYMARRRGEEFSMNLIDGVWCGYFARDLPDPHPELFLYSKADFYLPWEYLEEKVLATRKGRYVRSLRWDKSSHVDHLRTYKQEYTNIIQDFVNTKYNFKEDDVSYQSIEDQRMEKIIIRKQEQIEKQHLNNRNEEVNNRIRTSSFS